MRWFFYIVLVLWCAVAMPVYGETLVTNSVSLSATTGGNHASGADGADGRDSTTSTGRASADISIVTTINGEVVTDIAERVSSEDGSPVSLSKRIHVSTTTVPAKETNTVSAGATSEEHEELAGDPPVLSTSSFEQATPSSQTTRSDDDAADIISISSSTDVSVLLAEAVREAPTIVERVMQAVTNFLAYVAILFS